MVDEPQRETSEVSANKLKVGWQLFNLTFAEWRQAFGARPYRRTCERLPDPAPPDSSGD